MTDKGYFNIKQTKRSNPEARTTLDNLHQLQISQFQKERDEMGMIEQEIANLTKTIEESSDIVQKTHLEEALFQIKKRRDDWKSNKPVYDYFFDTGDILYKYYDLQDKIQQGGSMSSKKIVKAKPGSVLAALGQTDTPSPGIKQKKEEEGSKSSIFCFFYFFSKTILGLDLFKNDDFFKVGFLVVVNSDLLS